MKLPTVEEIEARGFMDITMDDLDFLLAEARMARAAREIANRSTAKMGRLDLTELVGEIQAVLVQVPE